MDSWNHSYPVTYDPYYSSDGGTSWILLSTLQTENYLWDSDTVTDSSNYTFRVVASNAEELVSEFITNPAITIQNHTLASPTILMYFHNYIHNN